MTAARDWLGRLRSDLIELAIPVAFLIGGLLNPLRRVCTLDPDEGNNLIKALLLGDGHRLYAEIWSDQPPLLTYMLRGWLAMTGWTVESGRLLVLLCAAVLLWALHWTVRRTGDRIAAAAACLILIVSFDYLRLSVSVMLAVPSLMFAMLSVQSAVASGSQGPGRRRLLLAAASGALLGAAMATKLWVTILVPAALLAVVVTGGSWRPQAWWRPVTAWCAGWALVLGAVAIATVPADQVAQLVMPHVDVRESMDFSANTSSFWTTVGSQWAMALLGLIGLAGTIIRRRAIGLVPIAWLAAAVVALVDHRPLWYHHALLLSVPLAWGGGLAVAALVAAQLRRRQRRPEVASPRPGSRRPWPGWARGLTAVSHVVVLAVMVMVAVGVPGALRRGTTGPDPMIERLDRFAVVMLESLADADRPIVTDRQTLAFRAGLRVPPALAVTSIKRLTSGHLGLDEFVRIIDTTSPDVVLLSGRRVPPHPTLIAAVERERVLLFAEPTGMRLYVTRRVLPRGAGAIEAAAEAVPDCWQAQLSLAQLRQAQQRTTEAVVAWRRAAALVPQALRGAVESAPIRPDEGIAQVTEP